MTNDGPQKTHFDLLRPVRFTASACRHPLGVRTASSRLERDRMLRTMVVFTGNPSLAASCLAMVIRVRAGW